MEITKRIKIKAIVEIELFRDKIIFEDLEEELSNIRIIDNIESEIDFNDYNFKNQCAYAIGANNKDNINISFFRKNISVDCVKKT